VAAGRSRVSKRQLIGESVKDSRKVPKESREVSGRNGKVTSTLIIKKILSGMTRRKESTMKLLNLLTLSCLQNREKLLKSMKRFLGKVSKLKILS